MRKRIISIVLLAVLLLGVMPAQTFAAGSISSEGRICAELGMLKGDTGVVDERYLNTRPTRFQAAIMFLRLKGLENAALSYTGDKNFNDAGLIVWQEGRNLLSYLKGHPELGWIGDGYNFKPNDLITSREYYKVLLEALGYKQTIDGAGDFTWDKVLEFAESKGLYKVANVSQFTVDSLAAATVEALKAKLKDSDTRLVVYLIQKGLINRNTAEALGLYKEQVDAAVESVSAISNSRIEVVFKEPVYDIDMEYRESFIVNRGTTELDIKDIYQKNDYSVILRVDPMSSGTDYTVSVNGNRFTITGVARDSKVPGVIAAQGKDTDLVEVIFDKLMDAESAQNTSNYAIKDLTIKAAKLDATNTRVLLTTQGMQFGRSYELKITNVKSADDVVAKSITARFTGKRDITAPTLQTVTVINNRKVEIKFKDANGLDKGTAGDRYNYTITSGDGELDVISAAVSDKDNDGMPETVMLTTDTQTAGKAYTLHINNISDNSVLKNKIARELKKDFRGKSEDRSAPRIVGNPYVITNTKLEITFSDANALDADTACDTGNYEINNDLAVLKAEIKDPSDPYSTAGKTVILTTDEMEKSKQYTLMVQGIRDEFGNELDSSYSSKKYYFRGKTADNTPPYVISVNVPDDTDDEIVLNFDDRLDKASAENIRNYKLDGLSLITKAHLETSEKAVTLTTSRLTGSSKHTLLLNGIKDLAGNAMYNVNVNVSVTSSYYNSDPAEVAYIEAPYRDEVRVHFENRIKAHAAEMVASGIELYQVGELLDEDTTVVMKVKAPSALQNKEYYVTKLSGITNTNNKAYLLDDNLSFYGTTDANDPPTVDTWEQIDIRTFRVIFSEPVLSKGVGGIKNPSGVKLTWTAKVNPDDGEYEEAFRTIDYTASSKIPADKDYYFNFSDMVTDYVGTPAEDDEDTDGNKSKSTVLQAYLVDDDKPVIDYVQAVTTRRVDIVFDEEISASDPGSYKITYVNEKDKLYTVPIQSAQVSSGDKKTVRLLLGSDLSSEYVYTLKPVTGARDIAGNRMDTKDAEYDFEGVDIKGVDYLQGIDVNSITSLRVVKSDTIENVGSISVYEIDINGNTGNRNLVVGKPEKIADNEYEVTVSRPLLRDVTYRVTVDGLQYSFRGMVEDSDISIAADDRKIEYDGCDPHTQQVTVKRADDTELDVYKSNNSFYISSHEHLSNGETLYVYVEDTETDEIIYGARVTYEGESTEQSSEKNISAFAFKGLDPDIYGDIDESTRIIKVIVPVGTKLTALVPTIAVSPYAAVSPASGAAQDFSTVRYYTVTAENGTKKTYAVQVQAAVEPSSQKDILSFGFIALEPDVYGDIDEANRTIRLLVPYGTEITSLTPTISVSPKAVIKPASGVAVDFSESRSYTVTAENGTVKVYAVKVETAESALPKRILSFNFNSLDPDVKGSINEDKKEIYLTVPFGTGLKELVPTIEASTNTTVSPSSGEAADFSKDKQPVVYTVKAADKSTQAYKVYVDTGAANSEKLITSFKLQAPAVAGEIDQKARTIRLEVPYGTKLNQLVPIIETSAGATVSPHSGSKLDLSTENTFTVTAQDGSTAEYSVTVQVEKSSEKTIERFAFEGLEPGIEGDIDKTNNIITLTLPYGTKIDNLVPTIKVSEAATVEPKSGAANDFTNECSYTVTAQDGSKANYVVKVSFQKSSEKLMTAFSIVSPSITGSIDEAKKTITLNLAEETVKTDLVATFKCSEYAKVTVNGIVQESSKTPNNFTAPIVYRVTAQDGSYVEYTVTAVPVASNEKRITSFYWSGINPPINASINDVRSTIWLTVPRNTDIKHLVVGFTFTGSSVKIGDVVQVSGVTENDFSRPLKYTVTAADGSSKTYTVVVSEIRRR